MATGSSQAASPDGGLVAGDLRVLHKALYPARNSYKSFGLQIGVNIDEIEAIEGKNTDHGDKLLAILRIRLKKAEILTWNDIYTALREECVGESKTADDIRKKYDHLFSHEPSIQCTSERMPEKQVHFEKQETKTRLIIQKGKRSKDYEQLWKRATLSGRKKRKKSIMIILEEPESDEESSAASSEEKEMREKVEKVREKTAQNSEQQVYKTEGLMDKKSKESESKKERVEHVQQLKEQYEPEVYKREVKRMKNVKENEVSEFATDAHDHQYENQNTNKKGKRSCKKKAPKWVKTESGNEFSAVHGEEMVSTPLCSKTRRKTDKSAEAKTNSRLAECKEMKVKKMKTIDNEEMLLKEECIPENLKLVKASDKRQQYSVREVSKKPALKSNTSKKIKLEESEDESSASSTEDDISEDVTSPECTRKVTPNVRKPKLSITCTEEFQKADKDRKLWQSKRPGKKQETEIKDKVSSCPMKEQHPGDKVDERANASTLKEIDRHLKTHSKPIKEGEKVTENRRERETFSAKGAKKAAALPLKHETSHTPQNASDDVESDSDEGSEGEEVSESKENSSNEEEDSEPDNKPSAGTSEDEVKTKSVKSKPTPPNDEEKGVKKRNKTTTGGRRKAKAAESKGSSLSLPGEIQQSDRDCDRRDQDVQQKKHTKRRQQIVSLTASGGSPPASSQEEIKKQSNPKGQRRKYEHRSGHKTRRKSVRKRKKEESLSSSTESHGSSPEYMLKNLTETERKNLKKIFKRSFGRLCFDIKTPVKLATHLQMKGLLMKSTMNYLLTSPESEKEKAIALVTTLQRRIRPRPDRMFAIIQVLLQDEALQEAGREMWSETGKICPERTAFVFGQRLPPPRNQPCLVSVPGHGTKSDTSSVNEASGISSLEVGQSLPQSGLSPVLAKYKQYLQSCYKARALAPADKYLPTLESPYINLAMISRGNYDRDQRDEFTRKTLHGGVDQILENKTPLKIEDLLLPTMISDRKKDPNDDYSRKIPIRFVLVEGPPGIGKSTFAWEVCRRWDEIESLRNYNTVVLLRLREKWVLNASSLPDLFRYQYEPELSKNISDEHAKTQGKNMLLVLDGFDEVSHSFHDNSVIKSILCRELLPECTIILTTRPSAKHILRSICQPEVDKYVEIIGFTEEERVRYIMEVFTKEPELQANFLKYMFLVPHIKSMMYIPLNSAIIAQVYYESQSSCHLAIPRTRTQLYKALTHSLLVRHTKIKEEYGEYTSMLPEGLREEDKKMFEVLAEFAFDSYHKGRRNTKVTFFKEDIPEGLVHFGFMNESTEMYASKGVERTFSFLHLSLQEYLAAWHLATSYSIQFQMAYHRLALRAPPLPSSQSYLPPLSRPYSPPLPKSRLHSWHSQDEAPILLSTPPLPHVTHMAEKDLLLFLRQLKVSLLEPAVFLAGITGWRGMSEDGTNHWERYLSHYTASVRNLSVLLRSLYEAQNPAILPHYFSATSINCSRREVIIGSAENGPPTTQTPYDCYALSYCLAHSTDQFTTLRLDIKNESDVSLVETFVKGLDEHGKFNIPRVQHLKLTLLTEHGVSKKCLLWLSKATFLTEIQKVEINCELKCDFVLKFVRSLSNLQSLYVHSPTTLKAIPLVICPEHSEEFPLLEWLAAMKSLSQLQVLHITSVAKCNPSSTDLYCWPVKHRLTEIVLDIEIPSNSANDLCSATGKLVGSILKSVLRSEVITKMVLPSISRETMAGIHSILLNSPSLATLELKRTRLGYDGILYICSPLRNNTALRHLEIYDLQLPPARYAYFTTALFFKSMVRVPLPAKTTCTDFLLELNSILKDNTTIEKMNIQSGLFFPLYAGEHGGCQWTGLGPLQQFNVGSVASDRSPSLRRSFSSSDLTEPHTTLFWDRQFATSEDRYVFGLPQAFLEKEWKKRLFSLPSFTAPDTKVLQSFSGLDPRLSKCLGLSDLQPYAESIRGNYPAIFEEYTDDDLDLW